MYILKPTQPDDAPKRLDYKCLICTTTPYIKDKSFHATGVCDNCTGAIEDNHNRTIL